jgi:hypothetical protein
MAPARMTNAAPATSAERLVPTDFSLVTIVPKDKSSMTYPSKVGAAHADIPNREKGMDFDATQCDLLVRKHCETKKSGKEHRAVMVDNMRTASSRCRSPPRRSKGSY